MPYMRYWLASLLVLVMLTGTIPARGIDNPCIDISTDAYGNLFTLNSKTQRVFKFDDNMNLLEESLNSSTLSMKEVSAVTVCWCAGELSFASNSTGKTQMYEIDEYSKYNYHWDLAGLGSSTGQVINPTDITYLRSDQEYWVAITDRNLKKIVVIDDYGKFKSEITKLSEPKSCYFSPAKKLYVIDGNNIKEFSSSGTLINTYGSDILKNPTAIDASKYEDKYFVLDGAVVYIFDASGKKIGQFTVATDSVDLSVNIYKNWVVVASCSDEGTLSAYDYNGKLIKQSKSVGNPIKRKVLRFVVGSYVYQIDGVGVKTRCPVQIVNDRSLVPLREIVEPLGGEIGWDGATKTITINYDSPSLVQLQIGRPYAFVDGKMVMLPSLVPPEIYCSGVTMVPLRFVSEVLGASVEYFSEDKSIEVIK